MKTVLPKLKINFSRGDGAAYLGYSGYAAGAVVIPMLLVAMSGELDFDLASGGILHLLRSAVMVISMLLSGYAAAKAGKAWILGAAVFLIAAGLLMCSFTTTYALLVGAIVLIGLGNGFFESLATGFISDLHRDDTPGRYINITHSFWPLGILITVLGTGIALKYGVSWRQQVMVIVLFLLIPAGLFLSCRNPVKYNSSHAENKTGKASPLKNFRFLLFLLALFLAGGSEHCFTFWLPSLIELELAGDGILCGTGVALFAAGMFAGRFFSGIFVNVKPALLIAGCAFFCAAVSLAIPRIESGRTLMLILPLLGIATGPLWPSLQYCCASMLKEYDSTQLYILMPLFGIPGCGFFTWLLGMIGKHTGLRTGFYVVFFCDLLIAVLIIILNKIATHKEKMR